MYNLTEINVQMEIFEWKMRENDWIGWKYVANN